MLESRRFARASLPALAVLVVGALAFAQVGGTVVVPYQGRLEQSGELVDDTVSMTFRFYNAPTDGTLLDDATHDVTVRGGAFALDIGPVDRSVLEAPAVYLEVAIDGAVLGARQPLRAVPYAIQGQPGGPFVHQGAAVGDMGHGAAYAGLAHEDRVGTGTYAFLQSSAGETFVNAAADQRVRLRVNNQDKADIDGSGTLTVTGAFAVGSTRIEGLTVSHHTTTAQLPSGDPLTTTQGTVTLGPVSGAFCALTHNRVYFQPQPTSNFQGLDDGYCSIYEENGNWVLEAHAAKSWPFDHLGVDCQARCLRWDQP